MTTGLRRLPAVGCLLLLSLRLVLAQDGTTTTTAQCPSNLFQSCEPCREEFIRTSTPDPSAYNCSLPGLTALTPGMYEGVSANYLSFATETSSPNMPVRAVEFEACTGATIVFAEANNVWEDPIADLGSKTAAGIELYDGYFMSYAHFPEASALNLAEHLNDRIRNSNARLKWEDVLPKVRHMGEYRSNGETNVDFLMYDGDFFVPVIRMDLLVKHNKSLPNTWDEVVELATYFNGTDLNDDGVADDYGFCHFPRLGAGYWDWWWTEFVYSTWATFDQTRGYNEGFFFDKVTMDPRIKTSPGFPKAAEIWKTLWVNGADGCGANFMTGRCAIGFAPPGCLKGIFLDPDGVSRKDENGTVIWQPTYENGDYAEPYRFKPFGSTEVVDPQTGTFVECTKELCPKAEPIPPKGHMNSPNDRGNILTVSSPLEGKLVNRAPFYWSGGLGTLIRASAAEEKKDLLWDFFVYTNAAETSVYDVANYESWLDPWRNSQLTPGDNFVGAGWSLDSYYELASVMQWALSAEANGAMNLRLPGLDQYTRDSVGGHMSSYVQDKLTLTELATNVEKEWIEITATRGKLDQLRIYRASLNLDELSTFDLCTYHRVEMDQIDPSVCRVFDETGNDRLLLATLIPSVVMGLILGVFAYLLVRRKAIDSVWMIQLKELKFNDPPEILGRGTFGLVLLAEYRGTEVAVKRVIPRKNQMPRKTAAKDKPTLSHDKTLRLSEEKVVEKVVERVVEKDLLMNNSSSSYRSQSLAKGGLESERKLSIFFDAEVMAADEMEASQDGHAHRTRRRYSYITPSTAQDVERQDQTSAVLRRSSVESKCSSTGSIAENAPFTFASVNPDGPTRGESMIKPFSRDSVCPSLVKVNGLSGRESMGDVAGIMCNPKMPKSVSIWSLKKLPRLFQKDQHKILLEDFGREIRQLSTLRHPSIVSVMGAVIEKGKEPMLVLEFMHLGSLYDLLHNTTFSFEGGTILAILRDIAQGVYFLHAATPQVIHGDIKSHNILVDSRFRAKVADFGLSQKRKLGGASFAAGTPYWMAPELIQGRSGNTSMSDVYSLGVLLFEVYSRSEPYEGENPDEVLKALADKDVHKCPTIPTSTPPLISSLMVDCFNADPNLRPSVQELDIRLKRLEAESVTPTGVEYMSHGRKTSGDMLLDDMFPKHVADALRAGKKIEPEKKEIVTIFFSDVVGFTTIASKIPPEKVADMLDRLYLQLDDAVDRYEIFKVETIGDAYMCVTNLVRDQPDDHAKRIANFAIEAMKIASNTPIDLENLSMGTIQLRAGFHCGPVIASVIGSRNLKYSIFGDTVNTASRMESTSLPGRIQLSERAAQILQEQQLDANLVLRGNVAVKGKGEMRTYLLKE